MSRSILLGAAAIATAMFMPQLPAAAQTADDASITVAAPHVPSGERPRFLVERRAQLMAQVFVPTEDLDLRTDHGRDELDRRIRQAAVEACDSLDALYAPVGVGAQLNSDSQDCRHRAAQMARAEARSAIQDAG